MICLDLILNINSKDQRSLDCSSSKATVIAYSGSRCFLLVLQFTQNGQLKHAFWGLLTLCVLLFLNSQFVTLLEIFKVRYSNRPYIFHTGERIKYMIVRLIGNRVRRFYLNPPFSPDCRPSNLSYNKRLFEMQQLQSALFRKLIPHYLAKKWQLRYNLLMTLNYSIKVKVMNMSTANILEMITYREIWSNVWAFDWHVSIWRWPIL